MSTKTGRTDGQFGQVAEAKQDRLGRAMRGHLRRWQFEHPGTANGYAVGRCPTQTGHVASWPRMADILFEKHSNFTLTQPTKYH